MKKLSVILCAMVLVFAIVANVNAATINFDNLPRNTWADNFSVDGVWFTTLDYPYGFNIFGDEGYASGPNALSLNWGYYGAIGSITVTFPSLVNFVQITGGDKTWDGDAFTMSAFDSSGTFLTKTETGFFSGGGEGTTFNDAATIFVSASGIKSIVLSIQSSVDGVSYDNLIYENVPIPSAIWLLGSAFIGLMGFRKKLRKEA